MKKVWVLIFLLIVSSNINPQSNPVEPFKIVFAGYPLPDNQYQYSPGYITEGFLDEIIKWGATGVSIHVIWWQYHENPYSLNFSQLDNVINLILSKNLDLYFRVALGHRPSWAVSRHNSTIDDYAVTEDGSPYLCQGFSNPKYLLNFASSYSKTLMMDFYVSFLEYLVANDYNSNGQIKYIVPSITPDSEFEFPYDRMCGFSPTELELFRNYLLSKYASLNGIEAAWGRSNNPFGGDINNINPRDYNWHDSDASNDLFPNGKIDWINFRTHLLKSFFDELADITHSYGFKIMLQLGSIYDDMIINRGFLDPTPLAEKADLVMSADIYQYEPNFTFAADYTRSIVNFWGGGANKNFGTETNWPRYDGQNAATLIASWTNQLIAYYEKGASLLNIVGWDRNYPNPPLTILNSSVQTEYTNWKNILSSFSNSDIIQKPVYPHAVHTGNERYAYHHNNPAVGPDLRKTFDILRLVQSESDYANPSVSYTGASDIVTNYMLEENPSFFNNRYTSQLWFTQSSEYITNSAYYNLMSSDFFQGMNNASHKIENGFGSFKYTMGIKNERNQSRTPTHLIWRTRTDLQEIWPNASRPDPNSNITYDFIAWLYYSGCGFDYNPPKPEYPNLVIFENWLYNYDPLLRKIWDEDSALRTRFEDAHYNYIDPDSIYSLIEWVIDTGHDVYPALSNYKFWPYIGGGSSSLFKKPSINSDREADELVLYPNPTNSSTTLSFNLIKGGNVNIKIYNINGEQVDNIQLNDLRAGHHSYNYHYAGLASGVYFFNLTTSKNNIIKKVVLLK